MHNLEFFLFNTGTTDIAIVLHQMMPACSIQYTTAVHIHKIGLQSDVDSNLVWSSLDASMLTNNYTVSQFHCLDLCHRRISHRHFELLLK